MRKNRVRGGKERNQKVRSVREHEGSAGWSVAQESDVIKGCAHDAKGEITATDGGMASSLLGNRVGDMKGLGRTSVFDM
jgi:hypothetical protein